MKVPSTGAPPNFSKFSGPKNYEKSIFLVPMTIVEMFASHVPRRMQILSSGDGLEGHFKNDWKITFQAISRGQNLHTPRYMAGKQFQNGHGGQEYDFL